MSYRSVEMEWSNVAGNDHGEKINNASMKIFLPKGYIKRDCDEQSDAGKE